jgi:choline-sulfatase
MSNQKKPNILFFLSDQHSHRFTGWSRFNEVDTPNLQKLAREGVNFTNTYCQNPLCVPSRCSLLTGKYSKDLGIYENRHILESNTTTIPRVLGEAGYRTCLIGKAHFNGEQFHGYQQRPYGDLYGQAHQPEAVRSDDISGDSGLGDILGNSGATDIPLPLTQTEICVSEAVKWLQCHADTATGQPFFLSVNFDKPHFPMRAPRHLFEKYEGKVKLPEYPQNYLADSAVPFVKAAVEINGRSQDHHGDQAVYKRALAAYCACVEWVDDAVGRILHALAYLGLADDTLVIYSSDHGEMAGEKGAWQKTLFFDQSAKVPLIIKWPGQYRRNVQVDDITGSIDLFPTLCAAADVKIPDTCSGADLTPLLKGSGRIERDAIFSESAALKHPEHAGCMIRTPQYKYALYLDGHNELYDMENDPGEWHNLSGRAEYRETEEILAARVRDFWHPEDQIDRYNRCPAMKNEKHFYLYSNQFISSDGRVINARP